MAQLPAPYREKRAEKEVQKREASRELRDNDHRSPSAALSAYPDDVPRHRTTTERRQHHSVSLLAETSS